MTDSPALVHIRAAAKINLDLRVVGRRPDGFHDIRSWMQPIDWYDELTLRLGESCGIDLSCDRAELSVGPDNLICRAISALARRVKRPANVHVHLSKQLPLGGGVGGGSTDAAAALAGMARLWSLAPDCPDLHDAAAEIGSDVPFFLARGAAIATGRGERLSPHPSPFDGWAVLILPPFGIPTGPVYAACRAADTADATCEPPPWAMPWTDAAELSARLRNDLTTPASVVEPRLADLLGRLDRTDGAALHMSGSGSTLFALFDDDRAAHRWQQRVAPRCPECRSRIVRVLSTPPLDVRRMH